MKRALWIIGIILATISIVFYFLVSSLNLTSNINEENELKFDKNTWIHFKTKRSENARHYMLSDLKNHYLKIGLDSNVVIKILGKPDERRFGFSYNLGFYESGFDPSFLILEFDKNGKLLQTRLKTI